MKKLNTVAIFIPTYNASPYLENFIISLNSICSKIECKVYFIDSSSTDGTVEYIRSNGFTNITEIDTKDFDHGGSRSMAKTLCNEDIIIYLTQDALPISAQDITSLLLAFNDESIGAAYGRQLPYDDTSLFGQHLRMFNYPKESVVRTFMDKEKFGIKTAQLSNSFSAYRRTAMDKIGWFKNGLILGEDIYAGAKLLKSGYDLAYVANAQVYHSHSYSVIEDFKRYFDIGVFHKMEKWILVDFGKPEGEGIRYIKSELKFLGKNNALLLLPEFIIRNFMKFLGYKLGKHYNKLPIQLIKKLSMHHRWWH